MTLTANERMGTIISGALTDTDGRLVVVGPNGVSAGNPGTGQGKTLLFAAISTAASGVTQLVAAVAALRIKLVGYVVVASAPVTVKFQSGGTDLTGAMALAANGGLVVQGQPSSHLMETAVNTALNINLGGAVQVSGHIAYFTE